MLVKLNKCKLKQTKNNIKLIFLFSALRTKAVSNFGAFCESNFKLLSTLRANENVKFLKEQSWGFLRSGHFCFGHAY